MMYVLRTTSAGAGKDILVSSNEKGFDWRKGEIKRQPKKKKQKKKLDVEGGGGMRGDAEECGGSRELSLV